MNQLFDHSFIDNHVPQTLVLFHGTGGTKSDFLFLDNATQHQFNLLGLQGNIVEQGMARFFKRTAPGMFDQKSIEDEAQKLSQFITHWCSVHHQTSNDLIFLGYSNGANMILATLFLHPKIINTAVLLHPMLPFTPEKLSLKGKKIMLTHGQSDPMTTTSQQQAITNLLQDSGAQVTEKVYASGHELLQTELQEMLSFLLAHQGLH